MGLTALAATEAGCDEMRRVTPQLRAFSLFVEVDQQGAVSCNHGFPLALPMDEFISGRGVTCRG